LSLQGFTLRTTAEAGSSVFPCFGVTIAEPTSGAVFRFRGGGL
jgi:hypothetical protein